MTEIKVNTQKPYSVLIEENLIEKTGVLINRLCNPKKILIITDSNISKLYHKYLRDMIKGYRIYSYIFEAGEKSKNITTVIDICNLLNRELFSRNDLIIALGGGITTDIAGFAASIFKRGIDYISIPTSLLAMIDSSVGGKTGVNTDYGKNLLGSFYQPKLVIIDPTLLKTLPKQNFNEGMAEVIKCALIKSNSLFEKIYEYDKSNLIDIIIETINIKKGIVEQDEFEKDKRILLNFGHTIGNTIEKLSNYSISHGQAVMIGIIKTLELSKIHCGLNSKIIDNVKEIANNFMLLTETYFTFDAIGNQIVFDKKVDCSTVKEVLLQDIEKPIIKNLTINEYERVL